MRNLKLALFCGKNISFLLFDIWKTKNGIKGSATHELCENKKEMSNIKGN